VAKGWRNLPETTVFMISTQDQGISTINYKKYFLYRCDQMRAMVSSLNTLLDHTQRRTTFVRTLLDECSVRRRDFYTTTHNNRNRQLSIPPAGFESAIPSGERPQSYALQRAAIEIGYKKYILKDKDINKDTCRKCRGKLETLKNVMLHVVTMSR
jgi:hypothetical protein